MPTFISLLQDDFRFALSYMRMVGAMSAFALQGYNPLDQLHELMVYTVTNGVQGISSRLDVERMRFHWEKDPLLLARGKVQVTVYYRITDEGPEVIQSEDNPWPDKYCGEFFMNVVKLGNSYGIQSISLQDEQDLDIPELSARWRITDHEKFAETWVEADVRMCHEDLYLPGTNVPREEATEAIYNTLRMNLPSKQVF